MRKVLNIVIAGLGGQGVLKASDILSEVVFRAGLDIKKSEVHGMSQRGGSVASDIRFGTDEGVVVYSPMIPAGEADFLVVLSPDQVDNNRWQLKADGVLITPSTIDEASLSNKRSINVALMGALSRYLEFSKEAWLDVLRTTLPQKLLAVNESAFELGRRSVDVACASAAN